MKANLVLAVILLLLATIYFATETENKIPPEATEAFNPLLKGFDENLVTRIILTQGDDTVTIFKNTQLIKKSYKLPENFPGEWLIENANFHVAKTDVVSKFLSEINGLKKGFSTTEDPELFSDDVNNFQKFGVDEENALQIKLYKQVSDFNDKQIAINEIPYFALLIGNSSETEEIVGQSRRFVRIGTFDEATKKAEQNSLLKFDFSKEIRRVKDINLDILNADLNRWIELDVFKFKDMLNNIEDFECVNIINNDDLSKSIYLGKKKTEVTDEQGNTKTENKWGFFEDPMDTIKLEHHDPVEEANKNSVEDFLYDLKAFRAKGYYGHNQFKMTLNGDLSVDGIFNGRRVLEGELHKHMPENVKEQLAELDDRIRELKTKLYKTPNSNKRQQEIYLYQISSLLFNKMRYEDSRILRFYVFEENKEIRTGEELKKTIEDSGKSVDDVADALKFSKTTLHMMVDGQTKLTEEIIERIRSEFPYMFHNYWLILSTSRFDFQGTFIFWQYSISYDQLDQRLSPKREKFEIAKPEDTQTPPKDGEEIPSDDDKVDENTDAPTDDDSETKPGENDQQTKPGEQSKAEIIDAPALPQIKITTNFGEIVVELFEDDAPNTVASFISLCEKGFYNNIRFHKIFNDESIHVGCPYARGEITSLVDTGDPGYRFSDEIKSNSRDCDAAGYLLMDNTENGHFNADSNGSKFFVSLKALPDAKNVYTIFGKIVSGLDVAQKIGKVETVKRPDLGKMHSPMKDIYIIKTEVLKKRNHEYKVIKIEDE